jgi:hypothetical protein
MLERKALTVKRRTPVPKRTAVTRGKEKLSGIPHESLLIPGWH